MSSPAATNTTDLRADLEFALTIADAADRVTMAHFDTPELEVRTKSDASPVTNADLTAEQSIRELIGAHRPGDSILGEEYGASGNSGRQWIIDPIDGTANFVRGIPMWATLIALVIDDIPRVGVVSQPALNRRWWAATGRGAWTNSPDGAQRIAVSQVSSLTEASVSFQSIRQWRQAGHTDALLRLTEAVRRDRGYGDAWPYMLLAEGRLEFVGEFDLKAHDIAAHLPIITEAGGRFSTFAGEASLTEGSLVATNGILHEAFLDLLHPPAQKVPA